MLMLNDVLDDLNIVMRMRTFNLHWFFRELRICIHLICALTIRCLANAYLLTFMIFHRRRLFGRRFRGVFNVLI